MAAINRVSPAEVSPGGITVTATVRPGLGSLVQEILEKKIAHMEACQKARTGSGLGKEVVLVAGDFFTTGELVFAGAKSVAPKINTIAGVAFASLVCGEIAGLINLGVACVSLVEGIRALKNGDKALAARLCLDWLCFSAIAIIMILSSLAIKVAALGSVAAVFAANPWLMPVLFFIGALPVLAEISGRIAKIATGTDFGSQLMGKGMQELKAPFLEIMKNTPREQVDDAVRKALSEEMEKYQASIGVEAAIEAFRMIQRSLKGEDITEQRRTLAEKIASWNEAQFIRFFQQVLFILSFALGMIALVQKSAALVINTSVNFSMALANLIPLWMDLHWPFKRNAPIVVPSVI
jgi:histone H3/H4